MDPISQTEEFSDWLRRLKDSRGRAKVITRLLRLADGNPGDADSVGQGVMELRIHYGPGYRVYFARLRKGYVALLGGDKSTQDRDVRTAQQLLADLQD